MTSFRNELLRDAVAMYDELVRRNPGEGTLGLGEALNNQTLLLYLLGDDPPGAGVGTPRRGGARRPAALV